MLLGEPEPNMELCLRCFLLADFFLFFILLDIDGLLFRFLGLPLFLKPVMYVPKIFLSIMNANPSSPPPTPTRTRTRTFFGVMDR